MRPVSVILLIILSTVTIAHAQPVAVELEKQNLIYAGLENPVAVAVLGVDSSRIIVKSNEPGVLIKKISGGKYVLMPDGSSRYFTLSIGITKRSGKIKWIAERSYRIRKLPDPETLFGTRTGGPISKGELLTVRRINAGLRGLAFEGVSFSVISYRISIIGPETFLQKNIKGNQFPDELTDTFSNLKGGEYIVIDEVIAARKPTGDTVDCPPVFVYLTDKRHPTSVYSIHGYISKNNKLQNVNISIPVSGGINYSYEGGKRDSLWQFYSPLYSCSHPTAEQYYHEDTLKWVKVFYPSGKLKYEKRWYQRQKSGTYTEYFEDGKLRRRGGMRIEKNFRLIVDRETNINHSIGFKATYDTLAGKPDFIDIQECLFGKWEEYYPNGKLKQEGNFDTTYTNTFEIIDYIDIPDPSEPYKKVERPVVCYSVKNGKWLYYDNTGKLIGKIDFDMGLIKSR